MYVTFYHYNTSSKAPSQPEFQPYKGILEDPQELHERILSLLDRYSVQNPKIWRIFTPEVPPWRFLVIQKCLFLNKKSSTPQQEKIYSAFLGHKEKNNSIHIYADGSNMEDREWASLVAASIFIGFMYVLRTSPGNYNFLRLPTLLQDLKCSYFSYGNRNTNCCHFVHQAEMYMTIYVGSLPGHSGVAGNENSCISAKSDATNVD